MWQRLWSNFLLLARQASDQTGSMMKTSARRMATKRHQTQRVIVRQHRPDYQIVMYMVLLMLIGLVLIYAIGPQRVNLLNRSFEGDAKTYNSLFYSNKQMASLVIALIAFGLAAKMPLERLKQYLLPILGVGLGVGVVLAIFSRQPLLPLGLAQCSYGACRWLNLKLVTVQVAEVMKLSLVIFFAGFWKLFADQGRINQSANLFYSGVILVVAFIMIAIWQNDLGTGLSMVFILLAMLWNAGVKPSLMLTIILIGAIGAMGFVAVKPHRVARVMTFLKGDDVQITDQTRHIVQAKIAVGSGGMFGLGIGKSVQATGYLPEAINDSIFAIVGELFGFVGTVGVIGLFAALIARLLRNAVVSHDMFYRLLIVGAAGWVFSHFAINITSMLGMAPMTGITLPFLSYGGTSMIFISFMLGLAFNASRFTAHTVYRFGDRQ